MFSASEDGTVAVWDKRDEKPVHLFKSP